MDTQPQPSRQLASLQWKSEGIYQIITFSHPNQELCPSKKNAILFTRRIRVVHGTFSLSGATPSEQVCKWIHHLLPQRDNCCFFFLSKRSRQLNSLTSKRGTCSPSHERQRHQPWCLFCVFRHPHGASTFIKEGGWGRQCKSKPRWVSERPRRVAPRPPPTA